MITAADKTQGMIQIADVELINTDLTIFYGPTSKEKVELTENVFRQFSSKYPLFISVAF